MLQEKKSRRLVPSNPPLPHHPGDSRTWHPRRELGDFSSDQCSVSNSDSFSVVGCLSSTMSIQGAGIFTWQKWHCGPVVRLCLQKEAAKAGSSGRSSFHPNRDGAASAGRWIGLNA